MVRPTFLSLSAICLIYTIVPGSAALRAGHMMNILERAELSGRADLTCSISGYTACNKNGVPGNFCCPSATECVAFNGGQSAICCPTGRDCSTIQPISCDVSQQNATAHPSSQLFTTDLSATLGTCGSTCCPQGYSCKNGQCSLSSSSTSSSAPSSAPTSTQKSNIASSNTPTSSSTLSQATNSPSGVGSAASHPTPSLGAATQTHCSQFPTTAVLVGFFSGLAAGIISAVLGFCCFGRRRKETPPASPNFSNVAASVSDPIYQPQDANGFRSDFLRRESNSKHPRRTSKVRSFFSRTPTMRSMRSRDAPVDGIGRSIPPRTPIHQRSPDSSLRKEPSMESIKIYSPPNMGLGRPNTTFTDMMADAGFKQGEPYLGSPGRGMPMP